MLLLGYIPKWRKLSPLINFNQEHLAHQQCHGRPFGCWFRIGRWGIWNWWVAWVDSHPIPRRSQGHRYFFGGTSKICYLIGTSYWGTSFFSAPPLRCAQRYLFPTTTYSIGATSSQTISIGQFGYYYPVPVKFFPWTNHESSEVSLQVGNFQFLIGFWFGGVVIP